MNLSDDAYTIMIFRGVVANPVRVRVPRWLAKGALVAIAVLCVVQMWGASYYVAQMGQSDTLAALSQEMSQSRGRMVAVSDSVVDIKRRMLAVQELGQKLQTMFGLEFDPIQSTGGDGQGGEDVLQDAPHEETPYGVSGLHVEEVKSHAVAGLGMPSAHLRLARVVTAIQKDLSWLDQRVSGQQRIFDQLKETAGRRVERWSATPSIWPVKGAVTSNFGPRISPFTGKNAFHSGVDIGARKGEKILAPAKGSVVAATYDWKIGNYIRLDHGYGIKTIYGHLAKRLVKRGQKVKRGDVIGLVGSTGKFSTGPHLHYQVVVNDKIVNPLQYILD